MIINGCFGGKGGGYSFGGSAGSDGLLVIWNSSGDCDVSSSSSLGRRCWC